MSYDRWKTTSPEELCANCGVPFRADNCTLRAESDAAPGPSSPHPASRPPTGSRP